MDKYDGTRARDSLEHFETFKTHMTLHGFSEKFACRALPLTLKRLVRVWFGSLAPGSIDSFREQARLFLTQFMASSRRRRPIAYLLTIK